MSLARVVAQNTIVQVVGRLIGLVLSVALTGLMTRYFGLATYGKFIAASTYVGLFAVIAEMGLYFAVVRRAAQEQEPQRRSVILGTALTLRLLLAAVPLGLAVALAQFIPTARYPTYDAAVKLLVILVAVNAYVGLLNQFMIAIFRLNFRMDLSVLGETVQRVVMLGGVLLVMAAGGGLVLVVSAMLAGSLTNLAYAWIVGSRFETFKPRFDRRLARELLVESAVLSVMAILGIIHFNVDTLLLSLLQPAQDVGVYGVAYKVQEVVVSFPGLFVGLLFPVFSRLVSEDPGRLRHVFQRAFDLLLLAAIGIALLVYVLASPLAELLGATQAAAPMRILALSLPAIFLSCGFTNLLLAEGRQKWLVGLYSLLVVVNIGANLVFIRLYSYLGAAGVTVGTECMSLVCLVGYWVGLRHWRLELRSLWGLPLAVGLGTLLVAAAGRWMPDAGDGLAAHLVGLVVGGLACAGLYLAGILGLRLLPLATLRVMWPGGARAENDPAVSEP